MKDRSVLLVERDAAEGEGWEEEEEKDAGILHDLMNRPGKGESKDAVRRGFR